MKTWKYILYLVIILLLLEVIKTIMPKTGFSGSYLLSTLLMCLQFFLLLGFVLFRMILWLIDKRLKKRTRLVLAGLIVLLFFAGAEFLFSSWLNNPKRIPLGFRWSFWYYYDHYDYRIIQYEKEQSIYDSGLFYRLKPSSKFYYKNREFNNEFMTNTRGLRDDEESLMDPAVICLGDSYGMGWGVEQEETFAQQLEKMSGLRVLNAGISSYGTARELKLLKQLNTSSLRFIIIQYCANDIIENEASKENNYNLPISTATNFKALQRGYQWGRLYFPGKYFLTISQLFLKQQVNKIYPVFKLNSGRLSPIKDEKKQALVFLEILCNAGINFENTKILVTMLESQGHMKNDFLNQVEIISHQEPYRTKLQNKLVVISCDTDLEPDDYYLMDLHIKASGHKKVARKLWQGIQAH